MSDNLYDYERHLRRGQHTVLHANEREISRLLDAVSFQSTIDTSESGRITARVGKDRDLPEISPEYGFKGGAARRELFSLIALPESLLPLRDLDILRIGAAPRMEDEHVARKYSPEDFAHGARVEVVRDLTRYFASRDLTINEAALFGTTLHFTPLSVLDAHHRIIRPSRVRRGTLHREPELSGRVLLKMLRLRAILGESWILRDIPAVSSVAPLDVGLNLKRVLDTGSHAVGTFLDLLEERMLFNFESTELETRVAEIVDHVEPYLPAGFFPALSITSKTTEP